MTLAVDIGGTKMAAGLVDEAGTLLHHHQVATPPGADADTLFAALTSVIAQVEGAEQAVACGVGSGGPMTGFGAAVSPVNIPGWRQFPLRDRLAVHTGLPTFVDNDAKALALAMRKANYQSVRGPFQFNVNHHPIQNFYLLDTVKLPSGDIEMRIQKTIFEKHKDAYSQDCKMKW